MRTNTLAYNSVFWIAELQWFVVLLAYGLDTSCDIVNIAIEDLKVFLGRFKSALGWFNKIVWAGNKYHGVVSWCVFNRQPLSA